MFNESEKNKEIVINRIIVSSYVHVLIPEMVAILGFGDFGDENYGV